MLYIEHIFDFGGANMYKYDDLTFENQNAKLLCSFMHVSNPYLYFPVGYVTEEFAVSLYNFLNKHLNIASDEYVPEPKKVCYVPLYSIPVLQ